MKGTFWSSAELIEALRMRRQLGMTYPQIANKIGRTPAAVEDKLQPYLSDDGGLEHAGQWIAAQTMRFLVDARGLGVERRMRGVA